MKWLVNMVAGKRIAALEEAGTFDGNPTERVYGQRTRKRDGIRCR